jgi:hypothetical protein
LGVNKYKLLEILKYFRILSFLLLIFASKLTSSKFRAENLRSLPSEPLTCHLKYMDTIINYNLCLRLSAVLTSIHFFVVLTNNKKMAKAIYLMTLSLLVAMMNGVKTLKLV